MKKRKKIELKYFSKQQKKFFCFKTFREDEVFNNMQNVERGVFERPETPENDFDCTTDPELID